MTGEFAVHRRGNVVTVIGDVDMATAPDLRAALAEVPGHVGRRVVDLSGATFLDSAGVAVLFDYVPGGLDLVVPSDSLIATVLRITGLTEVTSIQAALEPAQEPALEPHPHPHPRSGPHPHSGPGD
jgi:anti-anti-sigma factor